MNGTVFVLGAGASFGDTLKFLPEYKGDRRRIPPNPPLTSQFFDLKHLHGSPESVEQHNKSLISHIRHHWSISIPLGSKEWEHLSIEDLFTSLTLLNDFSPPGTDEKANAQMLLNDLLRYIRRSISLSMLFRFGEYTRVLAEQLKPQDSVINFNYDLLMDQELLRDNGPLQYQNFGVKFLDADLVKVGSEYEQIRQKLKFPISAGSFNGRSGPSHGLYLKPHGSLNWFTCRNASCPRSQSFVVSQAIAQCLGSSTFSIDFQCNYCHEDLTTLLVPPLAQKPILGTPYLRNLWSNVFAVLANAARIVIIGFSFQPSDFYASWLFRYALRHNRDAKVLVVNPDNAKDEFRNRMRAIFGDQYDGRWTGVQQINDIIQTV